MGPTTKTVATYYGENTSLRPKINFFFRHIRLQVAGSKTGYAVPSPKTLVDLRHRFGARIIPVVDACQSRLVDGALQTLLDQGFIVLTTGSKFYGGPPFSGCVLCPKAIAEEIDNSPHLTPLLLKDLHCFVDADLVSDDMPNLKYLLSLGRASARGSSRAESCDPSSPKSESCGDCFTGVLLRWAMALNEIRGLVKIEEAMRNKILERWVGDFRMGLQTRGLFCRGCRIMSRDALHSKAESPSPGELCHGGLPPLESSHFLLSIPRVIPQKVDGVVDVIKTANTPHLRAIENERDHFCTSSADESSQGDLTSESDSTSFAEESSACCMFQCNTIVSLTCHVADDQPKPTDDLTKTKNIPTTYRRLTLSELKQVHKLMTQDLSDKINVVEDDGTAVTGPHGLPVIPLPGPHGYTEISATTNDILGTKCFLGQPVALAPHNAVLRVAASGPLVRWIFEQYEALQEEEGARRWTNDGPHRDHALGAALERAFASDRVLVQKLDLILQHWDQAKDL